MAVKRTYAQIDNDYQVIKKAAEKAKSFKELEELTGFNRSAIMVSLSRHPVVLNRIKERFEEAGNKGACKKTKKVVSKVKRIVIDASIMGVDGIVDILKKEGNEIVLTSVTVKELAQMGRFNDSKAMRARSIMTLAAEDESKVSIKPIEEGFETADKCILEFCVENKSNVILYTADKEMHLLAKAEGVDSKFFKLPETNNKTKKPMRFHDAVREDSQLFLDLDMANKPWKKIRVISNGQELDSGCVKLRIGDDIYLASKKRDASYTSFAHYRVVSLWNDENVELIFSRRITDLKNLDLPWNYKTFLREFKRQVA